MSEALVAVKRSRNPYVGLFLDRSPQEASSSGDLSLLPRPVEELHSVGSFASLQTLQGTPDGGMVAWFLAHRRIRIESVVKPEPPPLVQIQHIEQNQRELGSDIIKALSNEIVSTIRNIVRINPMFKEQMQYITHRVEVHDAFRLADFAAATTSADPPDVQRVLEAESLEERLQLALQLLRREEELSKLQAKIASQVDENMKETQRKYFLNEQLKSIKKELGLEKDDKDALLQKYRDRAEKLHMPESAKTVFDEEMEKMQVLERNSSEFNVTRAYLDWITSIPWGIYSTDNFDIGRAREVLDEDHYGMADVKDRILEFIAVGKLKGNVQGKIICFVGPPGVGKTSIGKSIARALNREFYRFSVGGLSDVAEIKGHRRTYVGAMPGKLIQCLKSTQVSNPLILIDEVDKMASAGWRGDPASALLEMLDPNQNSSFIDHYMDTPVDASKVLFLCTANVLDTIPGPLRDRMEVIQLSGYDATEKQQILKRYLEPKIRKETGLEADAASTPDSLRLDEGAINSLIRWYARESGVRSLEKYVERLFRKVALKVVQARERALEKLGYSHDEASARTTMHEEQEAQDDSASTEKDASSDSASPTVPHPLPGVDDVDWCITESKLQEYIGKPPFSTDRMYIEPPAGVVMGLAYTSHGGAALYVEVTSPTLFPDETEERKADNEQKRGKEHHGSLTVTGQMGDVMQESSRIAHTFARRFMHKYDRSNDALERSSVHMHVPEGATPKDGPSAGCTMVTALVSLALNRPIRPDVAMTGEVTLTGKVLPVGGIREKCMAARRAGVSCIIIPSDNEKDVDVRFFCFLLVLRLCLIRLIHGGKRFAWCVSFVQELPEHLREGLTFHFAKEYQDVFDVALDYARVDEESKRP